MRNPDKPVYCPLCGKELKHVEYYGGVGLVLVRNSGGNGSYSEWYRVGCECGAQGTVAVKVNIRSQ